MLPDHRFVQHHQREDRVNHPQHGTQHPHKGHHDVEHHHHGLSLLAPVRNHGLHRLRDRRFHHQKKQHHPRQLRHDRRPSVDIRQLQAHRPTPEQGDPGRQNQGRHHRTHRPADPVEFPDLLVDFQLHFQRHPLLVGLRPPQLPAQNRRLNGHHDRPEHDIQQAEAPEHHMDNSEHLDPFRLQNRPIRRKIAHETS